MPTAHAVMFTAANEVNLSNIELPLPEADEVLVALRYSAISPGTELAFLRHAPNTSPRYPMRSGYSAVGVVEAVGSEVTDFAAGDAVACWTNHTSHALVPQHRCHHLPSGLDMLTAAPYRLASIALQGIRRAQIELGQAVAVVGCGPIGNLAGQIARAAGATFVEGIDLIPERTKVARNCGFDAVSTSIDSASRPGKYDVVIEATGAPDVIPTALGLTAPLGKVILLGSTRGITHEVNFYQAIHKPDLQVIGVHETRRVAGNEANRLAHQRDEHVALQLLAAERIQTTPFISEVCPAHEAPEAYRRLREHPADVVLIALDWQQ